MPNIYHLAQKAEWANAKVRGEYWPSESKDCAFIHFSFSHQVAGVASLLFKGRRDLILLEIDAAKVAVDLKIESSAPSTEKYPHLYRKLKCAEVAAEHDFQPSSDGSFAKPDKLK